MGPRISASQKSALTASVHSRLCAYTHFLPARLGRVQSWIIRGWKWFPRLRPSRWSGLLAWRSRCCGGRNSEYIFDGFLVASAPVGMQFFSNFLRESWVDYRNMLKVPAAEVLPAVSVAKTSMRLWPMAVP